MFHINKLMLFVIFLYHTAFESSPPSSSMPPSNLPAPKETKITPRCGTTSVNVVYSVEKPMEYYTDGIDLLTVLNIVNIVLPRILASILKLKLKLNRRR